MDRVGLKQIKFMRSQLTRTAVGWIHLMEKPRSRCCYSLVLAAAAGLSLGTIRAAELPPKPAQSEPTDQELIDKFNSMKARLEKLEDKEHVQEKKLESQSKEQAQLEKQRVDATVAAVQRDAVEHSQLLDMEGFTAGYSNGKFVIQSGDGSFSWHPWIQVQFRDVLTYRQDGKGAGVDDTQTGIEIRRLRWGFDGNLFSPDLTYLFNWSNYQGNTTSTVKAGTSTGTITNVIGGLQVLQEAWVRYKLPSSDFYVRAGQIHDPLAHEAIIGSKYEITAERSLQNDIFSNTDTYTEAATVAYDPKKELRVEAGINHGIRSANTNFQDTPNNGNLYDFGLVGRVEYKVMGNWKDYDQLTSYGDKSDLLVVGAGTDYSEDGKDAQFTHAFDAEYASTSGQFLYGSYIGRYTRHNLGIPNGSGVGGSLATPGVSGHDTYEPSLLLQASYLVDKHWEPFVRYEYLHLAGTAAGSDNEVQEISGGVGYWFHGHNAKLSSQLMYLPKGIPINDTGNDVLSNNKHGELVFMTQFQFML